MGRYYTKKQRLKLYLYAIDKYERDGWISTHNMIRYASTCNIPYRDTIKNVMNKLGDTVSIKFWNNGACRIVTEMLDAPPGTYTRIVMPRIDTPRGKVYYLSMYKLSPEELVKGSWNMINILEDRNFQPTSQPLPNYMQYSIISEGSNKYILWLEE